MALDPEELKRQRQLRRQQREKKQQQFRRLMVRLGIAGAVLLLCGGLIFSLSSRNPEKPSAEDSGTDLPVTNVQTQQETENPSETKAPTTVIHLTAAGDLNINDGVVASGNPQYDYTETFMDVAHLFADADIAVVNLEGNLSGTPYGTETRSAPQELARALGNAGVDFVQLANSYAINHGISGLRQTINSVREAGMEPLGVYADEGEFKDGKGYVIREIDGISVALVAFTKGMDGMALPAGSENCVNVLYKDYDSTYQNVDTQKITGILETVAKEEPDITIAFLHWGSEFNNTISKSQEQIVKLFQGQGVDAIIGTHSHYVQKMEYDPETGNFVAYSLGDFFGDAQRAGTEYAVMLDLEITKDNIAGQTKITNYSYTPIFTVTEKKAPVGVVRIEQAMEAYQNQHISRVSQENYADMQYAMERIPARIAGE